MGVDDTIEVVRRFGEALTDRDWAAFRDLVAEDCEWTEVPSGRIIRGAEELLDLCRAFTAEFPDFRVESVTLIGQGDLVANEWSGRGTQASTGRAFARTGVAIVEVRDGRIVRYRDYFDRQTMAEQLAPG